MSLLRDFIDKRKVHYTIRLKDNKQKRIQLIEHIEGLNRNYSTPIAIIFSWRAEIIKDFANRILKENSSKIKLGWDKEITIETEDAMRVLVALKLATTMKERTRIDEAFEVLHSLSDEEIAFWSWKILTHKNKALTAFKVMYL